MKGIYRRTTRSANSARDAGPQVQAPMRFLLALPVVTLSTPIEFSRLRHNFDECRDVRPVLLRLEHERDHRVRSEIGNQCLTEGLPCHTAFCADEECVLRIIHREITVAKHLVVSFLKRLGYALKQPWRKSACAK